MNPKRIDTIDRYDWAAIVTASKSEGYNMVNRLPAEATFDRIAVNVGTLAVGGFYEHLGFTPIDCPDITHIKLVKAHRKTHL